VSEGDDTRTGRPSKLTPERAADIAALIRKPMPATLAAMKCGIHRATYHRWMAEGAKDDAPTHFRDFRDVIDHALAEAAEKLLEPIQTKLADGSSEQAKYLLERMFPEEFGGRSTVTMEHSGRVDSSIGLQLPDGAGDAAVAFVRRLGAAADDAA